MFTLLEVAGCPFDLKCQAITPKCWTLFQIIYEIDWTLVPLSGSAWLWGFSARTGILQRAVAPSYSTREKRCRSVPYRGLDLLPSLCTSQEYYSIVEWIVAIFSWTIQQINTLCVLATIPFSAAIRSRLSAHSCHISRKPCPYITGWVVSVSSDVSLVTLLLDTRVWFGGWPEHFRPNHKTGVVLKLWLGWLVLRWDHGLNEHLHGPMAGHDQDSMQAEMGEHERSTH